MCCQDIVKGLAMDDKRIAKSFWSTKLCHSPLQNTLPFLGVGGLERQGAPVIKITKKEQRNKETKKFNCVIRDVITLFTLTSLKLTLFTLFLILKTLYVIFVKIRHYFCQN